jgi:hypothetical protein
MNMAELNQPISPNLRNSLNKTILEDEFAKEYDGFNQIDAPYKRPESPSIEPPAKESSLPEFLSRSDMAP